MLNKEDIILLFLEDPYKLASAIMRAEAISKSDETRTLICELGDPWCAYNYAKYVDKKQTDETREVCSRGKVDSDGYIWDHTYAEWARTYERRQKI